MQQPPPTRTFSLPSSKCEEVTGHSSRKFSAYPVSLLCHEATLQFRESFHHISHVPASLGRLRRPVGLCCCYYPLSLINMAAQSCVVILFVAAFAFACMAPAEAARILKVRMYSSGCTTHSEMEPGTSVRGTEVKNLTGVCLHSSARTCC